MKVIVATLLAFAASLALPTSADASTPAYANCTALRQVFHHGVARSDAAANYQVNHGNPRPAVRPAVYQHNTSLDRDKDGTACEG